MTNKIDLNISSGGVADVHLDQPQCQSQIANPRTHTTISGSPMFWHVQRKWIDLNIYHCLWRKPIRFLSICTKEDLFHPSSAPSRSINILHFSSRQSHPSRKWSMWCLSVDPKWSLSNWNGVNIWAIQSMSTVLINKNIKRLNNGRQIECWCEKIESRFFFKFTFADFVRCVWLPQRWIVSRSANNLMEFRPCAFLI